MKPAAFSYHAPASTAAAIALLAQYHDAAKILAGGQSLVPMMNLRLARPEHVIDINRIGELAAITDRGAAIEIGALTRHIAIERDALLAARLPILAAVARTIAHYAIRTQGTLGGSLAHADPAAQWPMLAIALDAQVVVRSVRGERVLAARDFLVATMTTALAVDELLIMTRWPVLDPRVGWGFEIFARRRGDFALCAVCALATVDQGRLARLQVVVGGVTPVAVDISGALQPLLGTSLDAVAARAGQLASATITPQDDPKAAAWYRTELIQALVARAVQQALDRARGG